MDLSKGHKDTKVSLVHLRDVYEKTIRAPGKSELEETSASATLFIKA